MWKNLGKYGNLTLTLGLLAIAAFTIYIAIFSDSPVVKASVLAWELIP